ncbi:hypothetical protein A3A93_04265 [Candidatus Roizmanbacteria bacterium RIFCSPLOWO2_01_FULL_38_12]|uniref:DUF304 domain-containing protein n=1 Tax=Candidatus Roizmanbacteria bacterium RIFCSPLOWO2_01_FULL_38_12 TaxID=1802061 RepID=A0A1F7IV29_9BACT|nr:MAG: hypothetical protein A3F59_00430 [Candidatus Roizmanbacteria bacterium RIFCSPHIGHO2_12_FULL_38_13]OGK47213.1 MAG: hypothetical protein A3A93_04265 [Candidatus Roizmanbacteria bacterium RIFCSPLOWO2_01_FULL_38_12]
MVQLKYPIYQYKSTDFKRVSFSAKSVFPFDLFPDEIRIDEDKVDIIYIQFLLGREVASIPIKNINSVSSVSNGIFGSVSIDLIGFHKDPEPIRFLWSNEAEKARKLINQLVCQNKEVSTMRTSSAT